MPTHWTPTDVARPADGHLVDWICPGGEQVDGGVYAGGAIWLLPPDHEVYVMYTPVYWRPAGAPKGGAT